MLSLEHPVQLPSAGHNGHLTVNDLDHLWLQDLGAPVAEDLSSSISDWMDGLSPRLPADKLHSSTAACKPADAPHLDCVLGNSLAASFDSPVPGSDGSSHSTSTNGSFGAQAGCLQAPRCSTVQYEQPWMLQQDQQQQQQQEQLQHLPSSQLQLQPQPQQPAHRHLQLQLPPQHELYSSAVPYSCCYSQGISPGSTGSYAQPLPGPHFWPGPPTDLSTAAPAARGVPFSIPGLPQGLFGPAPTAAGPGAVHGDYSAACSTLQPSAAVQQQWGPGAPLAPDYGSCCGAGPQWPPANLPSQFAPTPVSSMPWISMQGGMLEVPPLGSSAPQSYAPGSYDSCIPGSHFAGCGPCAGMQVPPAPPVAAGGHAAAVAGMVPGHVASEPSGALAYAAAGAPGLCQGPAAAAAGPLGGVSLKTAAHGRAGSSSAGAAGPADTAAAAVQGLGGRSSSGAEVAAAKPKAAALAAAKAAPKLQQGGDSKVTKPSTAGAAGKSFISKTVKKKLREAQEQSFMQASSDKIKELTTKRSSLQAALKQLQESSDKAAAALAKLKAAYETITTENDKLRRDNDELKSMIENAQQKLGQQQPSSPSNKQQPV